MWLWYNKTALRRQDALGVAVGNKERIMYHEIAKLILYGDNAEDCLLVQFGELFRALEAGSATRADLTRRVYTQVKRLLILATDYGFDKNLWHNYIAYFLITNENPFS